MEVVIVEEKPENYVENSVTNEYLDGRGSGGETEIVVVEVDTDGDGEADVEEEREFILPGFGNGGLR